MAQPCAATPGQWDFTGSLHVSHAAHIATVLLDGRMLIAAGDDTSQVTASAELYDATIGAWRVTGSLRVARDNHTATLLSDGRVLVTGEVNLGALPSAELYDATTGTWTLTGRLSSGRYLHKAILLANGEVIVVGGYNAGALASAELYDPATGSWTTTGSLNTGGRIRHSATLLPDGRVLVAAGSAALQNTPLPSAEIYEPSSGTWAVTGNLNTARLFHTANLLPDGKVLVAGGVTSAGTTGSAELYDPGIATATQASGRGSIDGQGDSATFSFHAKSGDRSTGSLSFGDPAAGISITKAKVRTLTFDGTSADLSGVARLGDGTKVIFSVSVEDNSSDGSTDTFSISLSNGYSAGGTLISGDIKIQ